MPPTARLPTAEFQSLLLPPIRIRLRTLHTFNRPQCTPIARHCARPAATCPAQRRSLHLYKTARARTALGMQKMLGFSLYEIEAPAVSNHRVNLVKSEFDHTPIAQDISLQALYDDHIAPGKMLYMTQPISKKLSENYERMRDEYIPAHTNNYAIVPAHSIEVVLKNPQTEGKQLGPLKGVHLVLANPVAYTKEAFDRAYQFIEQGSPVEFRVRLLGSVVKKRMKTARPRADAWPWMHAHFPHLRPDFILKSMPEGTEYLIKPVSDGYTVQFVLGRRAEEMPVLDLTRRVFRVKKAVAEARGMHLRGGFEEMIRRDDLKG
ncbi:hypothetical protein EKO04_000017 [Ascochyta lentis]|uniref:Uncharacterized protein n=1 Tax=Ascochyta lentis TaxID=205686 RepID=A0A8H7JAW0_9PLEO|nr:hypothetical protein EKO04_000017 [Ascochyta lentis]